MSSINYTISNIVKIIKGKLISRSSEETKIKDILIDSRKLVSTENCVFFALVSKKNDGHKYIDELYQKGIRNFVVSKAPLNIKYLNNSNFILVKNTLNALQLLSAEHRKRFDIPVIGITGSNGKTIVKEWLYQMMSDDKKIIRSPKSYNSQIGVPLSVWLMKPEYDLSIFEAGISQPDEMQKLQAIIQPTIGIFTNIGHAHDRNFTDTKQKICEKLKLFSKVNTLIYCSDYLEIHKYIIKSGMLKNIRTFTWSKNFKADLYIQNITKNDNQTKITGKYESHTIQINIPFSDDASIENSIHCWAAMLFFGYSNDIIAQRMLNLNPIAMRLELKQGINNCSIINDSYNSDINSINIALDFLNQQKQHKKKTVILSDVLQSAKNDDELYREIADLLFKKNVNRFIGIGKAICAQADKFQIEKYFFPCTDDFLKKFTFSSFHNETILIKGARYFEFEKISKALQQKAHETVLEINLSSLINNLNYYRSKLKPSTKIMVMVKAFSYGSGSFEIANALQFNRVDYLGVAYADEGVELRKSGITLPIMVMNPEEQSFDSMMKYNLEPEIYNFRILNLLEKSIEKNIIPYNKPVKIHIKLDTGMHRLGFESKDLNKLVKHLKNNNHIYVQSVFSHLAASDEPIYDYFTKQQIGLFSEMSNFIKSHNNHPMLLHILNSAGIIRFTEAQFDMVRLGIGIYGIGTDKNVQARLQNISTLKSTISQIKNVQANDSIGYSRKYIAKNDMKIATVPIGYADGLNRKLSNGNGKLLINGKFAPIVGNICMDMCMIDITNISAKEGDEVIIFGDDYPIIKLAEDLKTIPYEILTNISRRVKRIYFQE